MAEWNPNLYLKFEKERTQPVKDLINNINLDSPKKIIDIGCGPGNSTRELKRRWGNAHIVGIDNSKTMLEKAASELPDIDFLSCDLNDDFSHLGKYDVVFSNAVIQWVPNHEDLIKRLFDLVNTGGVLAIQIPYTRSMGIKSGINDVINKEIWLPYFATSNGGLNYFDLGFYYDILASLTDDIRLWETHYNHIMENHEAIIEWYKSTGLRPYLQMLPDDTFKNKWECKIFSVNYWSSQ